VLAQEDRAVRIRGRDADRDLGIDPVREEGDDRGRGDEGAGARERGDDGRPPRSGDARARDEGRKRKREGSEDGAAHGGPDAEVARALGGNGVRQRREDEARSRDERKGAREHEVVEALALPKAPEDQVRNEERDERGRGVDRDMELRTSVRERDARREARGSRQRGGDSREGKCEEANAHFTGKIGTQSPSA